jgi:hypothetical protein
MVDQTTPSSRRSSTIKSPIAPPLQEDNPITQKVSKILLNPIDDAKTKIALEALSEFYSNNNNNSLIIRRNLRGNIEQKAIETNRNFLEIFGKITEVNKDIYYFYCKFRLMILNFVIENFILFFSN